MSSLEGRADTKCQGWVMQKHDLVLLPSVLNSVDISGGYRLNFSYARVREWLLETFKMGFLVVVVLQCLVELVLT